MFSSHFLQARLFLEDRQIKMESLNLAMLPLKNTILHLWRKNTHLALLPKSRFKKKSTKLWVWVASVLHSVSMAHLPHFMDNQSQKVMWLPAAEKTLNRQSFKHQMELSESWVFHRERRMRFQLIRLRLSVHYLVRNLLQSLNQLQPDLTLTLLIFVSQQLKS